MLDYTDLIARLRKGTGLPVLQAMMTEAADAIEELKDLLDEANHNYDLAAADVERLTQMVGFSENSKWIPVSERLPFAESGNVSEKVLVTDGQDIAIAEWFNFEMCEPFWSYTGMGDISHWMPLPHPPEEEET